MAEWLICDIGADIESINDLREKLSAVERAGNQPTRADPDKLATRHKTYIGSGNAFSVYSTANFFYLEDWSGSEPRVLMPLSAIESVLAKYIGVIERGWNDPSAQPESFKFELIAEGDAARRVAIDSGLLRTNPS